MIAEKLSLLELASSGQLGLISLFASSPPDDGEPGRGTLGSLAERQRWASINYDIVEAFAEAAGASAVNHMLAAELEAISREVSSIRAGLRLTADIP